jgi:hypothetical protein
MKPMAEANTRSVAQVDRLHLPTATIPSKSLMRFSADEVWPTSAKSQAPRAMS